MPSHSAPHGRVTRVRRPSTAARLAAAAAAAAAAAPAWAAAPPPAGLGPWLFGTVALVLVAVLAYRLGRRSARPPDAPTASPTPSATSRPASTAADEALPATLAALAGEPGTTLRVCRRAPDGQGWVLLAAHPAPASTQPFAGVSPAGEQAAGRLPADSAEEIDGWMLRRTGEGPSERLVLRRAPGETDLAQQQASFSFTVSHDLRAPLRVVEGFARILKEDYGRQLDRIGNDHVDRVLSAAARMNSMIDAMLSLARLSSQPLSRQPVNLSQLATYVVDDLRRSAPAREVDVEIQPELLDHGDPTLLRQVLENLLANAWKYTNRCTQARIAFVCHERDGRRIYEVSDNGAGFDMRSAERLFGLFQRLHSASDFPGTGVGLASVQRIVRRHGGEIWADAEPGRGARFSFTLN